MCRVHTAADEIRALSELITRVNSSLDVDEVLGRASEVCAELTGCAGALLYLWDEEQERLVVRGASDGYRHWIGAFSLELGEGLTGWTALNRTPAVIREDALADPRYKLFPELNDSRFQSVLTVPIVGRGDRLVGVITLHAEAPHEFPDSDVSMMETIASLVAGAVENAKLHQQALRSVHVFRRLADLSRQMAVAARAPQTLQRLALTALELLDAAAVVVLRLDEARGRLVVETWVGGGRAGAVSADAVPAAGFWARLLGSGPASLPVPAEDELARRLGLAAEPSSLFAAPLSYEGRPVGLLCCYALEARLLGGDNLALLGTIANHAAIALVQDRSGARRPARVRDLFDSLRAGAGVRAAAAAAGLRIGEPHAAVVAEAPPAEDAEPVWRRLAARLEEVFPGTLSDSGRSFAAIVPLRGARSAELLERTLGELLPDAGAEVAAGCSDSTGASGELALAFRQARLACAVARSAGPGRRVRSYAGLGAQRYLWAISQQRDPDPLELAVGRLRELDRRRGSELFRTLEAYLEHQGNARRAAEALYVHRNTLRQRLRRIGDAIGLDPTDPSAAFELQLAVRLLRFRELGGEGAGRAGGGDP